MVTQIPKYFFDFLVTDEVVWSSNSVMDTIQEQTIINQILTGDKNAFSVVVDRYKDLVFTLAIRMLKNREEAEEVSQDVFIKIYKSLEKFKGDSKFSTWIYRVAYNTCLDRLKMNKRKYNEVAIDEFTEHQVKTMDTALNIMEVKERQQEIQNCLDELPTDDSVLLTLFYFEDMSLEEISKIVNISSNTLKVRLFRSRKKLASILKHRLEPEIISSYERAGR